MDRDIETITQKMKRVFDLILASLMCFVALPIFLVVAIIIKLTSTGPAFFHQDRVGFKGRLFKIYKFRTMVVNAEGQASHFTLKRDPRITKIGRILRLTKLDELPQLINVIKGDMSLVGPRPDTPKRVNRYTPEMREILNVKPGITGIASLYLRNEEELFGTIVGDPDEFYIKVVAPPKIKLAMAHVNNNSIWFDIQLLLLTVWSLTVGRVFQRAEHPIIEEIRQAAAAYQP